LKTSIYLLHNKDKVKINKKNFVKVLINQENFSKVKVFVAKFKAIY